MRTTDWKALGDIQFLIYKRVADSLNAALSAIALSDMPDAGGQPATFWKQRATTKIDNVLNLFTAWEYLIRYKMGESTPERAIRPFYVNALLEWLAGQLQMTGTPKVESNPQLSANQETLQEALLLLYSGAFTQGTNVRLEMETSDRGMWFRIKFARVRPLPLTFDALLDSFGDHWRAQDTLFELATARDFVRLNGSELVLHSSEAQGEFAFFIWRAGVNRGDPSTQAARRITNEMAAETTGLIAEADLPKPTITQELQTSDPTPVLPPPSHVDAPGGSGSDSTGGSADDTRPTKSRRLADLRPAKFPLPESAFTPVTPAEPAPPAQHESTLAPGEDAKAVSGPREADSAPAADSPPAGAGESASEAQPDASSGSGKTDTITTTHLSDDTPVFRLTPPRPGKPRDIQTADDTAIIIPANIRKPEPPRTITRPPASTSTVALTNDTQTMRSVTPADVPTPKPAAPAGDSAATDNAETGSPEKGTS